MAAEPPVPPRSTDSWIDAETPSEGDPRLGLHLLCRGRVQGVGFRPSVARLARELGLDGTLTNGCLVASGCLDGSGSGNRTGCSGVTLELAGSRPALERFQQRLEQVLQPPAHLEGIEARWLSEPLPPHLAPGSGLRIAASPGRPLGEGWLAPALLADLAPCPECLADLQDRGSRRFRYPFLSCSRCGPRYSIATAEPWCRAHTTLASFPLCPACRREFEDPEDRRFHAETIACPACGPRLILLHGRRRIVASRTADPLAEAVQLLRNGGILALQGVGGFQLLVDATDAAAVARLRRRKARGGKPFALLVADPGWLETVLQIEPGARRALRHPGAPIVLLPRRPEAGAALPGVAPGAPALGVMLPASPLHHLISRDLGRPLVCTSGNRSGEALCRDPLEACERLAGIADAWLVHDRPIARCLDDSLLQLIDGRPALLRRGRGLAPEALVLPGGPGHDPDRIRVALGGDLKSAPALARGNQCWLAPHLGDLADRRTLNRLQHGLAQWLALLEAEPGPSSPSRSDPMPPPVVACDSHPGYLSHRLVTAMAPSRPITTNWRTVPHHLAHGLAVVAEHGLQPPLLLVAFDGLGHGEDNDAGAGARLPALRGGEVLRLEAMDGRWRARTIASLLPFPLPGGEQAIREPRRAALGMLERAGAHGHPGAWRLQRAFAPGDRELLLQAMAAGLQAPPCSSAGRLFDAAASLLGLVQVQGYEGQAGLRLQGLAQRHCGTADSPSPELLPLLSIPASEHRWLDWRPLLLALLERIRIPEQAITAASRQRHPGMSTTGGHLGSGSENDVDPSRPPWSAMARSWDRNRTAAWFHLALAEGLALALTQLAGSPSDPAVAAGVVLSGGCFQNALLLEACRLALQRRGHRVHWSEAVPCNDGGLALGQLEVLRRDVLIGGLDPQADRAADHQIAERG